MKCPANTELLCAGEALAQTKPILKWAGGKAQLLHVLRAAIPREFNRYAEPFLGGGALFFSLALPGAVVADSNPELVHFYEVVRDFPWQLLDAVTAIPISKDDYYRVRGQDPCALRPVERAARFAYLNKTCFNGLHRVNRSGQFNTPFGGRTAVTVLDPDGLERASAILQRAELQCAESAHLMGVGIEAV